MPTPVAFFGTPEFALPILSQLANAFDVRAVVTQPDKPAGKGLTTRPSAVAQLAHELDLPIFKPTTLKDEQFRSSILKIPVEVAIVAAYGKIIPNWLLQWPTRGMINVHGSLLPKYRGASPITGAILAGETTTGITFMQMTPGLDEGDILTMYSAPISDTDTTGSLSKTLSRLAADHIGDVVKKYLDDQISPIPQDSTHASYTSTLDSSQGYIDIDSPPAHLDRLIRAYYPWPGVWTTFRGKRVKLLPQDMVQMEGKKTVPLKDFLNGYPDFPLKKLS